MVPCELFMAGLPLIAVGTLSDDECLCTQVWDTVHLLFYKGSKPSSLFMDQTRQTLTGVCLHVFDVFDCYSVFWSLDVL